MSNLRKISEAPSRRRVDSPLVAAFKANDHDEIRRRGWWEPWEALQTWWRPPNEKATPALMAAYADVLGGEDPDDILDALRALAGKWRPGPSEVLAAVRQLRGGSSDRVDAGRARDRSMEPVALAAVARALEAGEQPCSCDSHSPKWRRASDWVLRCPRCDGLETGQVYAVEDMEAAA